MSLSTSAKALIWSELASSLEYMALPTENGFIPDQQEWISDPFYFHMCYDAFTYKERGKMINVLMNDVDRSSVEKGIAFFQKLYDGKQRNSPNMTAYPFFTLYKNTSTEAERTNIG